MTILHSAVLGIIQGLGEFLPVSSSGHLLLARIFLGIQTDSPALKMLDILLHTGTLVPVLIVFRREWADMILHPFRNRTLLYLFLASMPTLAVYVLARKLFPDVHGFSVFDNGWFLGTSFLITALFLLLSDRISAVRTRGKQKRIGAVQALVMGVFQGIGMIPGISRSGSTIFGGVSSGLTRTAAARFSFMMSAPAILGSLLMEGKDAVEMGYVSEIQPVPAAVGIVLAAVTGYFAIRMMLKIVRRASLTWFALYLAVIGMVYLLMQMTSFPGIPAFAPPAAVPSV